MTTFCRVSGNFVLIFVRFRKSQFFLFKGKRVGVSCCRTAIRFALVMPTENKSHQSKLFP
jgi:hypothetical protein